MKVWSLMGLGLILVQAPGLLEAQRASVAGRVLESDLVSPVQGVLVVLRNTAGNRLQTRLTNSLGRYSFTDIPPGDYSVSADMIGYGTTTSSRFSLAAAVFHVLDLTIKVVPVRLDGLAVSGERRCGLDPDEGIVLARLWSEVREALERASFTGEMPFEYETQSFTRRLNQTASRVIDEESGRLLIVSGVPYISLEPEVFRERGYVIRNDTTNLVDYYAPDADVLLSDAFTETHCFELEQGGDDEEGLIGIKFEPLPGRDLPEIKGVAWVEPRSIKLSHVEFQFQNVLQGPRQRYIGGRMDYAELPSGLWIIEEWSLRAPVVSARANRDWGVRRRMFLPNDLLAIHEVGGIVDLVRDPNGETVFDAHAGLVRGIVINADTDEPVPGVTVTLGDTGTVVSTDDAGEFRFGGVLEGVYHITFRDAQGTLLGSVEERPSPGVQTFIRFVVGR